MALRLEERALLPQFPISNGLVSCGLSIFCPLECRRKTLAGAGMAGEGWCSLQCGGWRRILVMLRV